MTDDDALIASEAKQGWVTTIAEHSKVPQALNFRSNRKLLPLVMRSCLESPTSLYHDSVGLSKNDSPNLISKRHEMLTDWLTRSPYSETLVFDSDLTLSKNTLLLKGSWLTIVVTTTDISEKKKKTIRFNFEFDNKIVTYIHKAFSKPRIQVFSGQKNDCSWRYSRCSATLNGIKVMRHKSRASGSLWYCINWCTSSCWYTALAQIDTFWKRSQIQSKERLS